MTEDEMIKLAIHEMLLSGQLVQVEEINNETHEYRLTTPEKARALGLKVVPYTRN